MAIILNTLTKITLYRGATSIVSLDLTEWDMSQGSCLFTVKKKKTDEIIKQETFTSAEVYTVMFQDDETALLTVGVDYYYDIMLLQNNERYPQCAPSPVEVKEVVGSYAASN